MEELPDEVIEAAESRDVDHPHEGVSPADGSLAEHLQSAHQLPAQPGLSAATQQGLHDRVHNETDALAD